jgi:topoisomerase-4 subunit B
MAMAAPPVAFDTTALLLQTLVLYALAEAQAGHATQIGVVLDGRHFRITDNGRGHAVGRQVDGVPYLRLVYGQLGFPFGQAPGPAVQLQGLATSLVQALCSRLVVTARRDGQAHRVDIRDGVLQQTSRPLAPGETGGNTIEGWLRPDLPHAPDTAALLQWLQAAAAAVPGLRLDADLSVGSGTLDGHCPLRATPGP